MEDTRYLNLFIIVLMSFLLLYTILDYISFSEEQKRWDIYKQYLRNNLVERDNFTIIRQSNISYLLGKNT